MGYRLTGPPHRVTPDGRYFVVRGRLWRCSDPSLTAEERDRLVGELMAARRAKRSDPDPSATRSRIDVAKRALGERGPVWWNDGAPDYNRHLAKNTPYARWFDGGRAESESDSESGPAGQAPDSRVVGVPDGR